MKLPYETYTSLHWAQKQIQEYLQFLGGTEILFQMTENYDCKITWRYLGHEVTKWRSAKTYVDAWFKAEPWTRAEREQQKRSGEVALAVINFWYLLRDECKAQLMHDFFEFKANLAKSEEISASLLLRLSEKPQGRMLQLVQQACSKRPDRNQRSF